MLNVSHVIENVTNLGPGKRICIWFSGCSKKCKGCCSPELQDSTGKQCDSDELALFVNCRIIETGADGVTVSGGDPLEQDKEEMLAFLKSLIAKDILVFTGYTEEEVKKLGWYEALREIGVTLKCGRYVQEKDAGHPLMGSSNQSITCLSPMMTSRYREWIDGRGRELQMYRSDEKIYFTGLASLKEE